MYANLFKTCNQLLLRTIERRRFFSRSGHLIYGLTAWAQTPFGDPAFFALMFARRDGPIMNLIYIHVRRLDCHFDGTKSRAF